MITKHQTLQAGIALAIALPAHAGYSFALAISPEIRLQPGSHVHLPARLTNTGTLDIAFGPGSGAFSGQFNDLTLRPGEHIAGVAGEDLKSAERDELIKKHGYKAVEDHE
jgi:hypothetical protein